MHSHAHGHHDHSHGHPQEIQNISFSFVIAVAANLGFTVLEAFYAFIADSASLLADAGHNLSDVLGLLLAWGAAYLATQRTSKLYSYGFRRTTIMAALINAVVLILASVFIAIESVDKLLNPSPISEIAVMVVAGIGIVVNAGSALLFRQGSKKDLNLKGAYLHLAYDALISVGVVVSAAIIYFTGWIWLDGVAGLMIVVVIVLGTWGLLRDSINLMLDAVPQHIDREEVLSYLCGIEGVTAVHDLHIWALSTNESCLTAHLVMPENTLWDSDSGYGEVGQVLQTRFDIHHVTLQVEKDTECATQDCD
ncbi:MAG: cation transporter [Gammaproteobacteria bacterium]|jgi:cobalt-zinc-cadmium efflux system protein|nr:cation transporter [Gammaproteobacteria bacterium]MBT4492520.1 cation transporter [Gammaproteobacteria bacterium]MBT7369156.1 cation transporter [Gammaproteobacteria bacterium]